MKTKKKQPSNSAPGEKLITENDTSEIQDFIKELGLEQYTPDLVSRLTSNREKKVKGKSEFNGEGPVAPKSAGIATAPKPKAPPPAKYLEAKRKKLQTKTAVAEQSTSGIPPAGLTQPAKNKKIIFDDPCIDSGDNQPKKNPNLANKDGHAIQPSQNKKVVFDESYIVNGGSKDDFRPQGSDAWYNLLVKPDIPWYLQGKKLKSDAPPLSHEEASRYEAEGKRYLDEDTANFQKVRAVGAEKSESRWIQTVLTSGAFSDKIAAHTLLLQESVAHNLASLKFLISLLDVKGRRECLASLDALLRLFTEGRILNPTVKLTLIGKQPVGALSSVTPRERKELLALWSFEHQLKDHYNQFIQAMDGLLKDAVDATRRKAISAITILLAYSPEQEQGLLSRLVNKVGDPTRAVATTAVAQMEKLLQQHGNMKPVVVAEVERLLYRPNINTKAQYYALCFLSQILLDDEDDVLAAKLITIYVSFFKSCVKKGEIDSKLMAALLTGIKRAYPYTNTNNSVGGPLEGQVDTLFKLVHMVRFGLAVQVLCILDQIVLGDQSNADRFYSVLFRKLFDAELTSSPKQAMFVNLLYRALKRDESLARLRAFVKRILQVCLSSPPTLGCGLLYLVSELIKIRPELQSFPRKAKQYVEDDEDDEEHYKDADDDDADANGEDTQAKQTRSDSGNTKETTPTWIHRKNTNSKSSSRIGYDPLARNPVFGRAELSGGLWEMNLLAKHFHPSVANFGTTIMESRPIDYTGDPLQDFSLLRFLDRFVFRNPKQVTQSACPATRRILGKRNAYQPQGVRAMAVASKEFARQPQSNIPVDQLFLYHYFKQRTASVGPKAASDEDDEDMESVASEEFEQYLAENTDFDFAADMKAKPKKKDKKRPNTEDGDVLSEEGGDESDLDAAEEDSEEDFENDEEFQNAFKDFDDMLAESGAANENSDEDEDLGDEEMSADDSDDEAGTFREEDVAFSDDDDGERDTAAKPKMTKTAKLDKLKKTIKAAKKRGIEDDGDDLDWAFDAKPPSSRKKRARNTFGSGVEDFVAAEDFAAILEANAGTGLNTVGTTEALANKDKASVKQLQWEMSRDRWLKDRDRPRNDRNRPKRGGGHNRAGRQSQGGGRKSRPKAGAEFRVSRKRGGKR